MAGLDWRKHIQATCISGTLVALKKQINDLLENQALQGHLGSESFFFANNAMAGHGGYEQELQQHAHLEDHQVRASFILETSYQAPWLYQRCKMRTSPQRRCHYLTFG